MSDLDIPEAFRRQKGEASPSWKGIKTVPALRVPPPPPQKNGKRLTQAAQAERRAIEAEVNRISDLAKHGRAQK